MLTYDPVSGFFCKVTSKHNNLSRKYHIQFFGKQVTRAWITRKDIATWDDAEGIASIKARCKNKGGARLQADLEFSMAEAKEAATLRTLERLGEYVNLNPPNNIIYPPALRLNQRSLNCHDCTGCAVRSP